MSGSNYTSRCGSCSARHSAGSAACAACGAAINDANEPDPPVPALQGHFSRYMAHIVRRLRRFEDDSTVPAGTVSRLIEDLTAKWLVGQLSAEGQRLTRRVHALLLEEDPSCEPHLMRWAPPDV